MATLHQHLEWREASVELRVAAWACAVCGMTPQRAGQLQGAHLFALSEIRREFGPGAARQRLTDAANLAVLCRGCHFGFDYLLAGVCNPARLSASTRGRLWARVARHLPEFAALLGRRVRYRAQLRRERADGSPHPVAGRPALNEEQLIADARARFDEAMVAHARRCDEVAS